MDQPSEIIFNKLSEIESLEVTYDRPDVIKIFPCVTFYINENTPEYTLEREIGYQNIEVVIDIWAKTKVEADQILTEVEEKMRELDYLLNYSADILEPEGSLNVHVSTRFRY